MDKLIQEARETAASRGKDMRVLTAQDVVGKIEKGSSEEYRNGFRDYHGPRDDAEINQSGEEGI